MTTFYYVFFLISIHILISCQNTTNKEEIQVVIDRYAYSKLEKSDTTTLTIVNEASSKKLLYGLSYDEKGKEIAKGYIISITDNKEIVIDFDTATFVAQKEYFNEDQSFTIKKYYYNSDGMDEESTFYFMNERLIAYRSEAWNLYTLYRYEGSSIDKLVEKDTSSFFYRFKRHKIN